jgi:hypothetical protein
LLVATGVGDAKGAMHIGPALDGLGKADLGKDGRPASGLRVSQECF